jgi:hypothetical protein
MQKNHETEINLEVTSIQEKTSPLSVISITKLLMSNSND